MPDIVNQALVPLLVAAVVTYVAYLYARSKQRQGKSTGYASTARISWLGSYGEAFQRCLDILGALGAKLVDADPNRGAILASTPMSALSYGSTVRITLRTEEGVTYINVEAGASASLFDWGVSRRFIESFIRAWERLPGPIKG